MDDARDKDDKENHLPALNGPVAWGKVIAFHDFGAGRTMEISGGSASRSSVMLPFTAEAVPEVDVEGGKVVVDPPAGVLPGGETKEA